MIKSLIARYTKDESGATAIEYGLIAALISIVIIATVTLLGTEISAVFTDVTDGLKTRP